MKIQRLENDGELYRYYFMCPGCGIEHFIDNSWSFNNDYNKPTFNPSILTGTLKNQTRCHSFIKDGKIQFLGDCAHELKNQTVDLPDIEKLL